MRLTMIQIASERPEIEKAAYEKYPVTKEERRGCWKEKAKNEWLRFEFAKKQYEAIGKKEYD